MYFLVLGISFGKERANNNHMGWILSIEIAWAESKAELTIWILIWDQIVTVLS